MVEGQGLDLMGLVTSGGDGLLESLDLEVRADVEAAARLLAARGLPPAQDPSRQAFVRHWSKFHGLHCVVPGSVKFLEVWSGQKALDISL